MTSPDDVRLTARQQQILTVIRDWVDKGLGGLRVFTGGSTKDFDPSELDDPRAYPPQSII